MHNKTLYLQEKNLQGTILNNKKVLIVKRITRSHKSSMKALISQGGEKFRLGQTIINRMFEMM